MPTDEVTDYILDFRLQSEPRQVNDHMLCFEKEVGPHIQEVVEGGCRIDFITNCL